MPRILAVLLAAISVLTASPGHAQGDPPPIWYSAADKTSASLVFGGEDSPEDVTFVLYCDSAKKTLRLTVYEEIAGAKLGQPVTITLTAGPATAMLAAKTATNEMMGFVYGEAAKVARPEALFAVLRAPGVITIKMGPASRVLPEKGRAAALAKFQAACQ